MLFPFVAARNTVVACSASKSNHLLRSVSLPTFAPVHMTVTGSTCSDVYACRSRGRTHPRLSSHSGAYVRRPRRSLSNNSQR